MTHYIGLDAHSKTCTLVAVDSRGRETHNLHFATSEQELIRAVQSIPKPREMTFEQTAMARWMYPILRHHVDRLLVCDPRFTPKRRGEKDDTQDARHMAQQLRGNFLSPVHHDDNDVVNIRTLVASYDDLVRQYTRARNRYKALFLAEAIPVTGMTIYRMPERQQELSHSEDRFVAEQLFTEIECLRTCYKSYQKKFKELVDTVPEIGRLRQMPGIGDVRACAIAAIVGSAHRFRNKHAFWAYCELAKHTRSSDGVVYSRVNKRANKALKSIFITAAQQAINTDPIFKQEHDRLLSQGMHWRVIRRAIARKLAMIAWAVLRTGKPYDERRISPTSIDTELVELKS